MLASFSFLLLFFFCSLTFPFSPESACTLWHLLETCAHNAPISLAQVATNWDPGALLGMKALLF